MTDCIEDELKNLGIEEDFDDGDSDVTPTNSPISSITPPTIINYPVSDLYYDHGVRYYDDDDLRSDSSLSWGDDEFEGEATRVVNSLFEQLDQIIYEDDILVKSIHIPITNYFINKVKQRQKKKKVDHKKVLHRRFKSKSYTDLSTEQPAVNNNLSSSEQSLTDHIVDDSFGAKALPQPSLSLISECKDWVENFPHLRVNGIGVDIERLVAIERIAIGNTVNNGLESSQEEIIEQHGDYETKLRFVTLKREDKKGIKKAKGPPSRICSGSTDPEVLKEQLLIKLFEMLWPVVSKVVEPLLTQYAYHVINQSVQYSSISREPSSKGQRDVGIPMRSILMGSQSPLRGSDIIPHVGWRANRPLSASARPSSTKYRLKNKVPMETINREELQTFLQIKPLIIHDDRHTSPALLSASKSSSRSQSSILSLPTLSNHRPVSSKSSCQMLTPRLTADQRPTSTSSYTRLRFNNKYQNLNRNTTIEEHHDSSDYENEMPKGDVENDLDAVSPTWSRHATVLPPIPDVASLLKNGLSNCHAQPQQQQALSISGQSLSANPKLARTAAPRKSKASPQAKPFVSWIVSKVDERSNWSSPKGTAKQANKINNNNIPIDRTRYYRRASHH